VDGTVALSYRRIFLAIAVIFIGYLLWLIIDKDSAVSIGAVWPLVFAFVIILMLPERRLGGDLFVRMIEAMKGIKPNDPS